MFGKRLICSSSFFPLLLAPKRSCHAKRLPFSHWRNHGDPENSRGRKSRCVRRTGDSERLFPQLGLCRGTQRSPWRMGHGNLVQVCEVRAYLTDTHTQQETNVFLFTNSLMPPTPQQVIQGQRPLALLIREKLQTHMRAVTHPTTPTPGQRQL